MKTLFPFHVFIILVLRVQVGSLISFLPFSVLHYGILVSLGVLDSFPSACHHALWIERKDQANYH